MRDHIQYTSTNLAPKSNTICDPSLRRHEEEEGSWEIERGEEDLDCVESTAQGSTRAALVFLVAFCFQPSAPSIVQLLTVTFVCVEETGNELTYLPKQMICL